MVYMLWGSGNLRLVELREDLTGIKEDGFNDVVIENATAPAGDNIMLGDVEFYRQAWFRPPLWT